MEEPGKKVLIYRRKLLPYSETFILNQALALISWRPTLIGSPDRSELPLGGLDVRPVVLNRPPGRFDRGNLLARMKSALLGLAPPDSPADWASRTASALRGTPWVEKLSGFRLMHVHFGTNAGEAWPLAAALDIPMLITLHGYDITIWAEWWEKGKRGAASASYPSVLRGIADEGAAFVAVSEAVRESAIEFGLPASSIRTLPIGVDVGLFDRALDGPAPRKKILFVGRLAAKKGCDLLIRAFSQVKGHVPDAELVVIGDGKLMPGLKTLARELGAPVSFRGRASQREVIDEMRSARVLCAPSVRLADGDSEGLPTVIMEAQACGLPVVTSARGGATQGIIDGVTGFAFAEGDVQAMAAHLVTMLTDPGLADKFAAAARLHATSRFDIGKCTAMLETMYDDVAGRRGAQRR